jgi:GNAT superfamily N-acetyltransferase
MIDDDYVKEREGKETIRDKSGFARYFISGEVVWLSDIYIVPESRKKGLATQMADYVVGIAKQRGCTKLLGSVDINANGKHASLETLLAYGLKLSHINGSLIFFEKDI